MILAAMYPRTVKIRSATEPSTSTSASSRLIARTARSEQRSVVADLGRKDLLVQMLPKLQRLLAGDEALDTGDLPGPDVLDASTWGPVLAVRTLFDQLGLWKILDESLGQSKDVPFADRAVLLVANRLIRPSSEHRIAGWLGPTLSVTAKAAGLCRSGTSTDAFGCIPPSSRPGIARSISSTGPTSESRWRYTIASVTSSASSRI